MYFGLRWITFFELCFKDSFKVIIIINFFTVTGVTKYDKLKGSIKVDRIRIATTNNDVSSSYPK